MLDVRPKRCYVRRKKCLRESAGLVRSALEFINGGLAAPRAPEEMERLADRHAAAIEAVCWEPRAGRLTDGAYQALMVSKTRELCVALICQGAPGARAAQAMAELRGLGLVPPAAARPAAPAPRPPPRAEFPTMEHPPDEAQQGLDGFGEIPRPRFDGPDLFFEPDDAMRRWAAE